MINVSAKFWFLTVLVGQVIFSFYIIAFYYANTLAGDIAQYNRVMPAGYIENDTYGNAAVVIHVLFAALITIGGLLQLIPRVRQKIPAIHRWNGRLYIAIAIIMSLSGAFMVITRTDKVAGDAFGHAALMINGLIIIVCAIRAFGYARQRNFALHRIWALRLFVAVSGVWMFRIGLMAWIMFHGKPVGFDPATFSGPFLNFLFTLVYILPLLCLEGYLRAQSNGTVLNKTITASWLAVLTLIMLAGVFAAAMGMWLPRIGLA
mgnify:CR=1 FL=1